MTQSPPPAPSSSLKSFIIITDSLCWQRLRKKRAMCAVNSLAVNLCWETADKSKPSACKYLCVSVYSLSITSKLQLTRCTVACSPSGIIHRLVLQGCSIETTNRQDIEKALCCSAESKRTTCRFKKRLGDAWPSPATRLETNNSPKNKISYRLLHVSGCWVRS